MWCGCRVTRRFRSQFGRLRPYVRISESATFNGDRAGFCNRRRIELSPQFVSLPGQVGERVGEIDNGCDRGLRQRILGNPNKFDSAASKRLCARPR